MYWYFWIHYWLFYNNHKPKKIWQSFVHVILKNFPSLFTKYICIMGFMMITQHNVWWHDASIHCDFDTLQYKMKNIITVCNIYCYLRNTFINNFNIFIHVHIFLTRGKMPIDLKNYICKPLLNTYHQNMMIILCWGSRSSQNNYPEPRTTGGYLRNPLLQWS